MKEIKLRIGLLWILALVIGLTGAGLLNYHVLSSYVPSKKIPSEAEDDFHLMAEAWNAIEKVYVDRSAVKPQAMTYGAISGMVDALGDTGHSTFLTPDEVKEEKEFTRGRFKGIGAEIKMKDGRVVVVAPLDGSPAQKAGLRPGDVVLEVDGKDISGLSLAQVAKRISGAAGTEVKLTVLDPSTGKTRHMTIERASITVHNVTWVVLPGTKIAHLRIAGFSHGVTDDLQKALQGIKDRGLKGILLDLRNNPGGLLEEAVGSASQFLSSGNVVLVKNAAGEITSIPVRKGGKATNLPLATLINGGTASGAEIVAGALKDAGRSPLVGEKTFGTGTVLEEFRLSDGSALLLAVEEWLTPNGHTIWHQGIAPTLKVILPSDVAPSFPESERNMTPSQLRSTKDKQLLDALDLLRLRARATGKRRLSGAQERHKDDADKVLHKVHDHRRDKALPPEINGRENEAQNAHRYGAGGPFISVAEGEDPR